MAHPRTTTFHFTLSLPPSLSSFFSAFSKKTSSRKIPSLRRRLSSRTQEERYPRYPDKREQRGGEEAKGSEESRWREPNLGFAPYSIATETALSHQLEKSLSARRDFHFSLFLLLASYFPPPRANFSKSARGKRFRLRTRLHAIFLRLLLSFSP